MLAFFRGFRYAGRGIWFAIRAERNLRFHLCTAVYVYLFSLFYSFGRVEYILITLFIAGVISLELINSALERTVSRPSPERYVTAGVVKDMAAGAVLVFSVAAAIGGVLLFWDTQVFANIYHFFLNQPLWLVPLVVSLVGSWWFVFCYQRRP